MVRRTTPSASVRPHVEIVRGENGVRAAWEIALTQPLVEYRAWLDVSLAPEYTARVDTADGVIYTRAEAADAFEVRVTFVGARPPHAQFVLTGQPF